MVFKFVSSNPVPLIKTTFYVDISVYSCTVWYMQNLNSSSYRYYLYTSAPCSIAEEILHIQKRTTTSGLCNSPRSVMDLRGREFLQSHTSWQNLRNILLRGSFDDNFVEGNFLQFRLHAVLFEISYNTHHAYSKWGSGISYIIPAIRLLNVIRSPPTFCDTV